MNGIIVECVKCERRKILTIAEAAAIPADSVPMCDCGMPMVAVAARLTSRRSGQDLRKLIKR